MRLSYIGLVLLLKLAFSRRGAIVSYYFLLLSCHLSGLLSSGLVLVALLISYISRLKGLRGDSKYLIYIRISNTNIKRILIWL